MARRKYRAKVYVVGEYARAENEFVISRISEVLKSEVGDLVEVFLPAEADEFEGEPLSLKEAYYENVISLEECDFIVAVVTNDNPMLWFEIGHAHGLRKQVLTFSPRTSRLVNGLSEAVLAHITPQPFNVAAETPYLDDNGKQDFVWRTGLDLALDKLVATVRDLAPLYIAPQTLSDSMLSMIGVIKEKWGEQL
jgi:nucleoside 2-deoxyribosyltransferase